MTAERLLAIASFVCFVLMFLMFLHTSYLLDTARRASVELNDKTITVTCKEVSHD